MSEIMVSICCSAYNHGDYIEDALKGFVNQKTNFKYEVLIHDDASTDNTQEIIKKYHKMYPQLIFPVLQVENQYSKGVYALDINLARARGKYIAICEGDDYWIDDNKLQMQFDYMENHPDCTFCFSNAYIEDVENNNEKRIFIPYSKNDKKYYEKGSREIGLDEAYKISFYPTASIFFPKNIIEKMPPCFNEPCSTGDLQMRLYLTAIGYSYFIDIPTTVYRENVPYSAMTRWRFNSKEQEYSREEKIIKMIDNVDKFSGNQYTEALNQIKDIHIENALNNISYLKEINENKDYLRVFNGLPFNRKFRICIKVLVPSKIRHFKKMYMKQKYDKRMLTKRNGIY